MFANLMLILISAFNKTMDKLKYSRKSLKNFTYTDKETADDIYSSINSTQFLGVSVILNDFKYFWF
jgi:gamma-aminobutyric acid type B receptor